jgi:hypothetical protein
MNHNNNSVIAEVLVNASVKTVGKREFLKAVEKVLGNKREKDLRIKTEVPSDEKCLARVKGERTGIKVGRHVLFDTGRCERKGVSSNNLCVIHANQMAKFGYLPLGLYNEPVTDELKKVFGEI